MGKWARNRIRKKERVYQSKHDLSEKLQIVANKHKRAMSTLFWSNDMALFVVE